MDKNAQGSVAKSNGFVEWVKHHPVITILIFIILVVSFSSAGKEQKIKTTDKTEPSSITEGVVQVIPTTTARELEYKEIFSQKGKGNSNTESFAVSGGKIKVAAQTSGGMAGIGSYSGIELKNDVGGFLSNASLNISTKGSEVGTGETIIRDAESGKYFIQVISGVKWEVHVFEEK